MGRCIKERLLSNYFSPFGYIVAVLYLPTIVAFLGITGSLRTREYRSFRCPSSPNSQDDCLKQYDDQYNSPFPLYGFVLLCFVPITLLIACSWCSVKARVDALKAISWFRIPDPENPHRRPRVKTRRVFYSYFLHLLGRCVLGISFSVIQNFSLYQDGFPGDFVCVLTRKPTVNFTNFRNATKDGAELAIDCDNSIGYYNATCAKAIFIVNGLFVLLVAGELLYLSMRALKRKEFTLDSEFYQRHLFNKSSMLREAIFGPNPKRQVVERTDTYIVEVLTDESESEIRRHFDLAIYTGRAKHEFTDLARRHGVFDTYLKPPHGSVSIQKLEELFLPNEDTKDPRKILVVGRPGIGKSLLCSKLLHKWRKRLLLHDSNKRFDHLFLCQFRNFNSETKNISLKQLLSLLCTEGSIDSEGFQDILDNPEKVLFVFDGLDEFKHHKSCFEDEEAQVVYSPTDEMPFSALYVKLQKGKQLSGATVLTTCNPNMVPDISLWKFDRVVEIIGFTPEKVQDYIDEFCAHDASTVNKIWEHVSSNLELLSLCYSPVNSLIVCSILENLITLQLQDQDSESTLPTTSTEVCSGALRTSIFSHHPDFIGKPLTKDYLMGNVGFSDSVEETLRKAGSLAKAGIEKSQFMFDSTEVQGMEDCGLFKRIPDSKVSPYTLESHFYFNHLTLQELVAAREIAKMKPHDLNDFIISNASDPKWHQVIKFVAGLLHGQENEAVDNFVNLLCDSLTAEPPLSEETKQKALLMMKCLYEHNNEITVKKAASELQKNSKFSNRIDLSFCEVTAFDCAAIVYFIKHLHELSELDLSYNSITDKGVLHLCHALKDGNLELTELNLANSIVTDQGVSHLCDALKDENCKLTKLKLASNSITDAGVFFLAETVCYADCKLTKLNLANNSVMDVGVTFLCYALKDENCLLTNLNLASNYITDTSISNLCDALENANCRLLKLNLQFNRQITNKGKLQLFEALGSKQCEILINPF